MKKVGWILNIFGVFGLLIASINGVKWHWNFSKVVDLQARFSIPLEISVGVIVLGYSLIGLLALSLGIVLIRRAKRLSSESTP